MAIAAPIVGTTTLQLLPHEAKLNFASAMFSSVGRRSSNNYTDNKQPIDTNTRSHFENPSRSKIYEVSIPPGSAESVEVVFPEQGFYVGNDHDIGRFFMVARVCCRCD